MRWLHPLYAMCYRYIECPVGISSKNQGVKPGEVVGKSPVRDFFRQRMLSSSRKQRLAFENL